MFVIAMDSLEIRRQLLHASGVFLALLVRELYLMGGWLYPFILLAFSLATGYVISKLYKKGVEVPFFTTLINKAERERDLEFPGRGTLRFIAGSLMAVLVFRDHIQIIASSIIVLSVGDSAATLAGLSIGKNRLFYNQEKSVEGAVSGFLASFAALALLTPFPAHLVAVASLVGAFVETLPLKIDDNLTIPLAVGGALWLAAGAKY